MQKLEIPVIILILLYMIKGNKGVLRVIIYKLLSECVKKLTKNAFTLTEVLLAVAIVGIIAALVLPATITGYQTKVFELKENRQIEAIQTAIDDLIVSENKAKFKETIMYAASEPSSYANNAGLFLKKYMRVAKYCGDAVGNKSDCFAPEYSEYANRDKKVIVPELKGACAQLKNGTSICITPQVGGQPVKIVMDLNGPDGPNIVGRDFRVLQELSVQNSVDPDRVVDTDVGVLAENETPIIPDEEDPCSSIADSSNACCKYRKKKGSIVTPTDACCANTSVASSISACFSSAEIHMNYYPTGGTSSSTPTSPVKPYINASSNTYINPSNIRIPSGLTVRIKCANGQYGPTMSSSTLQSAIDANSGYYYFSGTVSNKSCFYSYETLLWDNNNSTSITLNGITYKLHQH